MCVCVCMCAGWDGGRAGQGAGWGGGQVAVGMGEEIGMQPVGGSCRVEGGRQWVRRVREGQQRGSDLEAALQ